MTDNNFWANVDRSGPCWLWTGATSDGYGKYRHNGRTVRAHRYAWEQANGPIPGGLILLHNNECVSRACVNPAHLRAGTHADNALDALRAGRHRNQRYKFYGRRQAAKLTPVQVDEIRALYDAFFSSDTRQWPAYKDVAKKYGVLPVTIKDIARRRTWSSEHKTITLDTTHKV